MTQITGHGIQGKTEAKTTKSDEVFNVCPVCGKKVSRNTGNTGVTRGSVKGLLACHIKYKHPEYWRGSLDNSLECLPEMPPKILCFVCGEEIYDEADKKIHAHRSCIDHALKEGYVLKGLGELV